MLCFRHTVQLLAGKSYQTTTFKLFFYETVASLFYKTEFLLISNMYFKGRNFCGKKLLRFSPTAKFLHFAGIYKLLRFTKIHLFWEKKLIAVHKKLYTKKYENPLLQAILFSY